MSDLLTHIGRLEMVDVDLDIEPQCEGLHHPIGLSGHIDGPAEYNVVFHCPCSRFVILACAGRVAYLRANGARCDECGAFMPADEIRFFKL